MAVVVDTMTEAATKCDIWTLASGNVEMSETDTITVASTYNTAADSNTESNTGQDTFSTVTEIKKESVIRTEASRYEGGHYQSTGGTFPSRRRERASILKKLSQKSRLQAQGKDQQSAASEVDN